MRFTPSRRSVRLTTALVIVGTGVSMLAPAVHADRRFTPVEVGPNAGRVAPYVLPVVDDVAITSILTTGFGAADNGVTLCRNSRRARRRPA